MIKNDRGRVRACPMNGPRRRTPGSYRQAGEALALDSGRRWSSLEAKDPPVADQPRREETRWWCASDSLPSRRRFGGLGASAIGETSSKLANGPRHTSMAFVGPTVGACALLVGRH